MPRIAIACAFCLLLPTALLPAAPLHAQDPGPPLPPPSSVTTNTNAPPADGAQEPSPAGPQPSAGLLASAGSAAALVKNITQVRGLLPHLLTGVGLVTGVSGSGSTDRATRQAVLNYINANNLKETIADINGGNAVLVTLTASLPPFATEGTQVEVQVQSPTDATGLRGGTLQRAELRGVDGLTYVVAQGAVITAGINVTAPGARAEKNPSQSGIVPNGFAVRPMESSYFSEAGAVELQLINPNVADALAIGKAIAGALAGEQYQVEPADSGLVRILFPEQQRTGQRALEVLQRVGSLSVPTEGPTTVAIDQVSGTVIAGAGIVVSPCVLGLSELTIAVTTDPYVVQPNPFTYSQAEQVSRTHIEVRSDSKDLKPVAGGVTVGELLQNLRSLGLTPAQLVTVFTELHRWHYLQARLEVR